MTAYTTFKTACSKCDKKLTLAAFNVHIGLHSLALCPTHEKALLTLTSKYLGEKL